MTAMTLGAVENSSMLTMKDSKLDLSDRTLTLRKETTSETGGNGGGDMGM